MLPWAKGWMVILLLWTNNSCPCLCFKWIDSCFLLLYGGEWVDIFGSQSKWHNRQRLSTPTFFLQREMWHRQIGPVAEQACLLWQWGLCRIREIWKLKFIIDAICLDYRSTNMNAHTKHNYSIIDAICPHCSSRNFVATMEIDGNIRTGCMIKMFPDLVL